MKMYQVEHSIIHLHTHRPRPKRLRNEAQLKDDLLSAFKTLKPHVQIIVIFAVTIVIIAVLKNSAPAVAIVTALMGAAGYVQAKRNSHIITTLTNRLNSMTGPEDKTFDPSEIVKAAKNGESRATNAEEHQKGETK